MDDEAKTNMKIGTYASAAAIIATIVTFAATYVFATKDEVSKIRTQQVKQSGEVTTEMTKIRGDVQTVQVKMDIIHREQQELRRSVDRLNKTITKKLR
ncbi:MAG: hypothetical protein CME17_01030 [Gemmatimonadetes bacterium]|nr:hypothetical protein [Gemmatimonadota bacterium]|tara:strand:- start:8437 stop:8730 length:294 start_codon:yes stop_codon:yes gene_type:complete